MIDIVRNKERLGAPDTEKLGLSAFQGRMGTDVVALGLAEPAEHPSRWREIAHRDRREVDSPIQHCPHCAVLQVVTFIGPVVLTPAEDAPAMSPIELQVFTFFLATRAFTHGDLRSVGCSGISSSLDSLT